MRQQLPRLGRQQQAHRHNKLPIKVVAYHLRDLQKQLDHDLPSSSGVEGYDRNDLIAYGYNSGPERLRDTAMWLDDLDGTGPQYISTFRENWKLADSIICGGGMGYSCTSQ